MQVEQPPKPASKPVAVPRNKPVPAAAPARRRSGWGWLITLTVLAGLSLGAWLFVTRGGWEWTKTNLLHQTTPVAASKGAGSANRSVPVVAATARKGNLPIHLVGLGTVTPYNTVTLRTRVDGQIMKVNFVEGQDVTAGDVLVEIDSRPYVVQREQAAGALAKDQASLKNAQADFQRYTDAADAVTKQQIDTAASSVAQLQGSIASDQAAIDSANLQITYCHITAPISGRVGLRLVDAGNLVHASDQTGLVVITQERPISVVFTIAEDQLPAILKAMHAAADDGNLLPVAAYDRDLTNKIADGTLTAVDSQIDPTTGTVKLKAKFANDDELLFPSQFVNVQVLVDTVRGAVLVPAAAVQHGAQDEPFIYVVKGDGPDNQTVDLRAVKLGPTERTGKSANEMTVITDGIAAGDLVVVDGVDKLIKGSKVTVRDVGKGKGGATQPGSATQAAPANQEAADSAGGSDATAGIKSGHHHKKVEE